MPHLFCIVKFVKTFQKLQSLPQPNYGLLRGTMRFQGLLYMYNIENFEIA